MTRLLNLSLLLLIAALPCSAAITNVQATTTATSASSSVAKVYVSTPTQGNLLIAVGQSGGGGTPASSGSITGWTLSASALYTSEGMGIWYKVAGASESSTVTLNWTSSTATRIAISEWAPGAGFAWTLDKIANVNSTGAGVVSRSSGTTATTTVADELLYAAWGMGNTTTAHGFTNSFTLDFNIGTGLLVGATRIVTATGAYESTCSWTTSRFAGGMIATFAATPTASTVRRKAVIF